MTWMQTRDGHAVDFMKVMRSEPDSLGGLTIEEVAHALARINRFAGHTKEAYSVAQHSVYVSLASPDYPLYGLMHDAHESVMGDITSPVKMMLRYLDSGEGLRQFEQRLILAFVRQFDLAKSQKEKTYFDAVTRVHNLDFKWPPDVRMADMRMLATERRDLLGPEALPWNLAVDGKPAEPYEDRISAWSIEVAEETFLQRFKSLTEASE